MFHILLISVFSFWYFSIFSFSFLLTLKAPGMAISIMAQILSFLFTTIVSVFLALASISHWIMTSHKIFTTSFSTTPSGACSYYFSLLFRLCFPQFPLNYSCNIIMPCTTFVPTFYISSQYEILFHFSCHTFYKVVISCFIFLVFSCSLFELPVLARQTTWLPFQVSSQLFSASSMFLLHPFFLEILLQIVHTFFCFSIVLFPHPILFDFLLNHCIIFYCFCSFHTFSQ